MNEVQIILLTWVVVGGLAAGFSLEMVDEYRPIQSGLFLMVCGPTTWAMTLLISIVIMIKGYQPRKSTGVDYK